MRYRLCTLLILLAVLPPLLGLLGAWGWREYQAWREHQQQQPWQQMELQVLTSEEINIVIEQAWKDASPVAELPPAP